MIFFEVVYFLHLISLLILHITIVLLPLNIYLGPTFASKVKTSDTEDFAGMRKYIRRKAWSHKLSSFLSRNWRN